MGSTEKWVLLALVVAVGFYAFGLKALYLCGVLALIFLFTRPGRSSHR